MPNHDRTRLHVTTRDDASEAIEELMAFVTTYRNVDGYAPLNKPGLVEAWSGKPLAERLETPCLSHAFAPMPIEVRDTMEGTARRTHNGETWRTWAIAHWGTKWGTYQESHEITDDRIVIEFDSAWEPPWTLLAALAVRFARIRFAGHTYSEYDGLLRRFELSTDGHRTLVEIGDRYGEYDEATDRQEVLLDMDGNRLHGVFQ